jgi:hypothetical protein
VCFLGLEMAAPRWDRDERVDGYKYQEIMQNNSPTKDIVSLHTIRFSYVSTKV